MGFAPAGVLVLLFLVGGLALAVTRVTKMAEAEIVSSTTRSCNISISGTTVTATARGDRKANEAMRVWLEKENGSRITPLLTWTTGERNYLPDGGKWHYALGNCNATDTKSCMVSKAVTNLTAGKYTAHCDIIGSTSPEGVAADKDKCTGNPFCSVNGGTQACTGWKSCGDRDNASLTVR